MNYNEYDNNGNRNRVNISDIINDRKQRSRFFLFVYLIIFIVLIVFVRTNLNTKKVNKIDNNENKENEVEKPVVNEEKNDELKEIFSFIDLNNYSFDFTVDVGGVKSYFIGKRYNDKYSFTSTSLESVLYFNGTSNYIKAKDSIDGEYKLVVFPYVLVNYFDTNVLKELIRNSNLVNNIYEISNKDLGMIIKNNKIDGEEINTIELKTSNNKVTQIILDLSSAMTTYQQDTVSATIMLKYSDFGLIDDFKIE